MPTTSEVNTAASNFILDTITADQKINGPAGNVVDRHGTTTKNLQLILAELAGIGAAIYDATAAGLAGTSNGDYFLVKGTGNVFATLYLNVNGAAVSQELLLPTMSTAWGHQGTLSAGADLNTITEPGTYAAFTNLGILNAPSGWDQATEAGWLRVSNSGDGAGGQSRWVLQEFMVMVPETSGSIQWRKMWTRRLDTQNPATTGASAWVQHGDVILDAELENTSTLLYRGAFTSGSFNAQTTPGRYILTSVSGYTNGPAGASYGGFLDVVDYGGTFMVQRYTTLTDHRNTYARTIDVGGTPDFTHPWVNLDRNSMGDIAASADVASIVQPGFYFGNANAGYTGLPDDFNAASEAFFLRVENAGSVNGSGDDRWHLQTLYSMTVSQKGGQGPWVRPTWTRRIDGTNATTTTGQSQWARLDAGPLSGRSIVFLGDSITEFDAWPGYVGERTGATVYECGFGGARMAAHSIPEYDPFSMYRIAERIKLGDWSVLTQAAIDLLAAYPSDDNSANVAKLEAIDWNTVDLIVVNYGTNDFGGSVPLGLPTDATGTTFIGAIRKSVQDILSVYPHIQFLFVTPLFRARDGGSDVAVTTNGDYLWEYADAEISVCGEYRLPYLDLHRNCGINMLNHATFLSDELHPNATGQFLIADRVSAAVSLTLGA